MGEIVRVWWPRHRVRITGTQVQCSFNGFVARTPQAADSIFLVTLRALGKM